MIRIGEAASGEQEALIWGSLPGEGSFRRQLSWEKQEPLIKVLFVLISSFARGRSREGCVYAGVVDAAAGGGEWLEGGAASRTRRGGKWGCRWKGNYPDAHRHHGQYQLKSLSCYVSVIAGCWHKSVFLSENKLKLVPTLLTPQNVHS